MDSIYQFNAPLYNSESFPLSKLQGKTILIVNTASKCNFSVQLSALEKLYQEYKSSGFTILAFPCNQFGQNEPLDNLAIRDFYQEQFNISFEIFDKVMVNGPETHPLFNYLKSHTRGISQNRAIKWNFTKFLINSQGQQVARYAPRTKPETLKQVIESNLLQAAKVNTAKSDKRISPKTPIFTSLKA
ncbi:glutathione peroxidase [Pseudoalteromonas fuliginea]|uniref:Glutathione peroxidase n=1 Tax=Pseudoalteromonas fuliginea TaxID=1872678 RepID=A0ABD3YC45_9GAMM|nr:glutathione peroxidase [Pseudoalteromonas fuliginea]KDC52418.1 glutathione peroxidase [Pseudoalteromonas fuliginea]KJZ29124.1 glutathione peroxidase [Pseudoalteromonas fuliginea]